MKDHLQIITVQLFEPSHLQKEIIFLKLNTKHVLKKLK